VRQDKIESFVKEQLLKHIFSDEAIEKITAYVLEYIENQAQNKDSEFEKFKKRENELNSKLNKLLDMYLENKITKSMFEEKSEEITKELKEIKSKLVQIQYQDYNWIDEEKIQGYLLASKMWLMSDDVELQRKVIDVFVDKIYIYPDRIELYLNTEMNITTAGGVPGHAPPLPCFETTEFAAWKKVAVKIQPMVSPN
jgi:hypothetical protein